MSKLACVAISSWFLISLEISQADETQQKQKITETSHLFMSSSQGYRPGNLITRSQLEELQQYLRKSLGKSRATHSGLAKRALRDRAPLSRFFYLENGQQVLREAAEELGGYRELDTLSLTSSGRHVLKEAIVESSVERILAAAQGVKETEPSYSAPNKDNSAIRERKIFTLQDFLSAAFPPEDE